MTEKCMYCDKDAVWIRSTQFAGDHPFCEEHAKAEDGFGLNDSYEYWYEVDKQVSKILAGAEQMSDKGYSISTKEQYDEFVKNRNKK